MHFFFSLHHLLLSQIWSIHESLLNFLHEFAMYICKQQRSIFHLAKSITICTLKTEAFKNVRKCRCFLTLQTFQSSKSILEAKFHFIFLGEQLSLSAFVIEGIFIKVYLVQMCPNFTGSDSKSLTSYQKIFWICSLGYKNLLNFTWYTKKFHNCTWSH